jgi:hypothetical protein
MIGAIESFRDRCKRVMVINAICKTRLFKPVNNVPYFSIFTKKSTHENFVSA